MGKHYKKKFQKFHNKNIHQKHNNKDFTCTNAFAFPRLRENLGSYISLKEDQVGITEYVSPGDGFQGILKSRYSDFHVNEIDTNGQVLELNDLSVPQTKDKVSSSEDLTTLRAELKEIVNEEMWNKISSLTEKDKSDNICYIETTDVDKEKRTTIHKIIKEMFNGKITSGTVDGQQVGKDKDKKFIRVMKAKGGRERKCWTFPGEYVHFLVHKENWDTSEVATQMADRLNLRPSQVNYCGTKDKRAKTTQKFCIKKRYPKEILHSVKNMPGVRVGNFQFSGDVLKLGYLQGNRFRIALRNVTGDPDMIENSLHNLKEKGFINYFGLQRFGNCASVPTYEVGVALLKADYKLACELILKPRPNDSTQMKAMREFWWAHRKSDEAATMIANNKLIERKLLEGLAVYGENDYATALRKLPRNMLLLYPHAFQSLIFNKIVTRRIKEFGLTLIPGDLVYRNKSENDNNFEDFITSQMDIEDKEEVTREDEDKANDPIEVEDKNSDKTTNEATQSSQSEFKRKVKALTEADIESGNHTIYDVVLPLPGYDITYPDNIVFKWYEEFLNDYGLEMANFKHKVKTYATPGAYRKLLLKPINLTWKFKYYSTPEETLIASDWEVLNNYKTEPLAKQQVEAKFKALLLEFSLPSAAYATMLLRELLKSDISTSGQRALQENALGEAKKEIKTEESEEKERKLSTTPEDGNNDLLKSTLQAITKNECDEGIDVKGDYLEKTAITTVLDK